MKRSLFFILPIISMLLLSGCCNPYNHGQDYSAPKYNITEPRSGGGEAKTKSVTVDLSTAKISKKDCVTVYDFDFCAGSFPVYAIGAVYKGNFYLLLRTQASILNVCWNKFSGAESTPDEKPKGLDLNIESEGTEYLFVLPENVVDTKIIVVNYRE